MKIKELIERLSKYNPELEVMIDGYEGGVQEPASMYEQEIIRDYYKHDSYSGPHISITYLRSYLDEEEICQKQKSRAVIISRYPVEEDEV